MADDVELELEAVQAVYGSDCLLLQHFPPHLLVSLKPRTADDFAQQFVEAVLVIKVSTQYPNEPPKLELKETKGLDEEKISVLLSDLEALAKELACNPMLVALCEATIDRLTDMNQPEGNCCFCMFPLVIEDKDSTSKPFMKLLSCLHCFHSECFGRWWGWMLNELSIESTKTHQGLEYEQDHGLVNSYGSRKDMLEEMVENFQLKCPVCRKRVYAEDLEHVWNFLDSGSTAKQAQEEEVILEPEIVFSEAEIARKCNFDHHFKAQKLCGGIIEPRKLEVIVPGMYVSPAARVSSTNSGPSEEVGLVSSTM